MINFIYKDGNEVLNESNLYPMHRTFKNAFNDATSMLSCENHTSASATIILNVGQNSWSWEFSDYCCDDYKEAIINATDKINSPILKSRAS